MSSVVWVGTILRYITFGGEKVLCKITEANETGESVATYQAQVVLLSSTWTSKIMHHI
jgi:hypothetical protein